MDKVTSREASGMSVKPPVSSSLMEKELRAFKEHFSTAPGYEKAVLANLLEDTNEDTVLRILAHFNENLKDGCEKLKSATDQENSEVVWKTAHKIAGSAELLGFRDYANQSRELSRVVRATPVFDTHAEAIRVFLKATTELTAEISATCPGLNSFL